MSFSKIIIIAVIIIGSAATYIFLQDQEKVSSSQFDQIPVVEKIAKPDQVVVNETAVFQPLLHQNQVLPEANIIEQLFKPGSMLPIVETIVYTSKVEWLKGRPAYLGDYAAHYQTSKHFISRSLRGQADYFSQNISNGKRFNVLRADMAIQFHLVLDLSRQKVWFYYYDTDRNERVLLKTYLACSGRLDPSTESGTLTPIGQFALGKEIAVYKPGTTGTFNNLACEMITVFGSRWIPLESTQMTKGLGLHGVPWKKDSSGNFIECRDCIGKYESSGSIRLLSEDIEEIFSIIVTKPAFIHIVKDFKDANLPGKETKLNSVML